MMQPRTTRTSAPFWVATFLLAGCMTTHPCTEPDLELSVKEHVMRFGADPDIAACIKLAERIRSDWNEGRTDRAVTDTRRLMDGLEVPAIWLWMPGNLRDIARPPPEAKAGSLREDLDDAVRRADERREHWSWLHSNGSKALVTLLGLWAVASIVGGAIAFTRDRRLRKTIRELKTRGPD